MLFFIYHYIDLINNTKLYNNTQNKINIYYLYKLEYTYYNYIL